MPSPYSRLRPLLTGGSSPPTASLTNTHASLHLAHDYNVLAILRAVGRFLRADNVRQACHHQFHAINLEPQRASDQVVVSCCAGRVKCHVETACRCDKIPGIGSRQGLRAEIECEARRHCFRENPRVQLAQRCNQPAQISRPRAGVISASAVSRGNPCNRAASAPISTKSTRCFARTLMRRSGSSRVGLTTSLRRRQKSVNVADLGKTFLRCQAEDTCHVLQHGESGAGLRISSAWRLKPAAAISRVRVSQLGSLCPRSIRAITDCAVRARLARSLCVNPARVRASRRSPVASRFMPI